MNKTGKEIREEKQNEVESNLNNLLDDVCSVLGLNEEIIRGDYRGREYVEARCIYTKLASDMYPSISYNLTGEPINKGHCSIIHYRKIHGEMMDFSTIYINKYHMCQQLGVEETRMSSPENILMRRNELLSDKIIILKRKNKILRAKNKQHEKLRALQKKI